MSQPNYQTAVAEENQMIEEAVLNADATTLFILANKYAEQGDDEMAHHLVTKARKALRDEWAYDESVCN